MSYQPDYPQPPAKDENTPTVAMILEIVLGFFGFLGVGHIFTGRLGLGIGLMIGWWVYTAVAFGVTAVTGGFAACLFLPLNIGLLVFSGIKARNYAREHGPAGNWGQSALITGIGCLLIFVLLAVGTCAALTLLGPQIGNVFSDITSQLGTPIP